MRTIAISLISVFAIAGSVPALAECPADLAKVEKAMRYGSMQDTEKAATTVENSSTCETWEQKTADAYLSQILIQQARKIDPALRDVKAVALVKKAAVLDVDWHAHEILGKVQRAAGDYQSATESFQSAINLLAVKSTAPDGAWKNVASDDELTNLGREADEAKHLTASGPQGVLVAAKSDRAGNPGGVFSGVLKRGALGVHLPAPILFEYDSAKLTKVGEEAAQQVAAYLLREKPNTITVYGHTDHVGSESYNMDLSKRRAATVVEFLKSQSISARMTPVGKGFSEPRKLSDGSNYPQAKIDELNRRVEFDWNK
jgi:outer membrane protein OmpA-like peptidoglycan-associated protein